MSQVKQDKSVIRLADARVQEKCGRPVRDKIGVNDGAFLVGVGQ